MTVEPTADELPLGSIVVGRMSVERNGSTYQTLVFETPERVRVAVYLDKLLNKFRVIPVEE